MPFLTDNDAKIIAERFAHDLDADVALEFFAPTTGGIVLPGQEGEIAEYTRQILNETAGLSPKLHLNVRSMLAEPEAAAGLGVVRTPATAVIGRQDYGIRYYGIPAGYEFATLLDLIVLASKGRAPLAEESRVLLSRLKSEAHIQVFVTPTWPHCPRAARLAAAIAVESPKVRADIVEASEFPDLATQYNVYGVPKIIINETTEFLGAQPEPKFVDYVAQAAGVVDGRSAGS